MLDASLRCLIIHVVPTPMVSFSRAPEPPYYEGALLSLTCTMELHEAIDVDVTVNTQWMHGDDVIESSHRVSLLELEINSLMYSTSVTFDPLSIADSGPYMCDFRVLPGLLTDFVLPASGSAASESIIVQGKGLNRIILSMSHSTGIHIIEKWC